MNDKCPYCGAEKGDEDFYKCSTLIYCNESRGKSCYEAELCQLRERVAWLEKWREVVMHHARLGEYAWGQLFWASSIPAIQPVFESEQRSPQSFDAAVSKEMEAKQ